MYRKFLLSSIISSLVLLIQNPVKAQRLFIYSPGDNQFLGNVAINGNVCGDFDRDCVFNDLSSYGSEIGSYSIFNDISPYGSSIGRYSVCNDMIRQENVPLLILAYGNNWEAVDVLNIDYQQQTQIGSNLVFSACQNN